MDLRKMVEEIYDSSGRVCRYSYLLREVSDDEILNEASSYFEVIHLDRKKYIKNIVSAINYHEDTGMVERERYFKNSKYHREDGPAFIQYNKDNQIEKEEYWMNGVELDILQEMVIRGLQIKENNKGEIENNLKL